jgi:hypothetical protein
MSTSAHTDYHDTLARIDEKLTHLRLVLGDDGDSLNGHVPEGETVNYAHVGDLCYVEGKLNEVLQFIGGVRP